MRWNAKQKLPIDLLSEWDVKTTRFSQTCMAIKRFEANQFVQLYGSVQDGIPFLRFDVFGCQTREQFKNLNFGVDWPLFQSSTSPEEE